MQELWNEKFSRDGFLYGKEVNNFIKEHAHLIKKNGRILCLGEGEGRNALYFAKQGFSVDALDASDVGLRKLQLRACEEDLAITIRHTIIENWQPYGMYDAITSVFMHLPKNEQKNTFLKSLNALEYGGFFIAEFFSEDQLNFSSGGPKDKELLYKLDDLYQFFSRLPCKILKLSQEVVHLSEGKGHNGEASVVRIIIKRNP